MMRRIVLMLTLAALMVAMVALSAVPAFAQIGRDPGEDEWESGDIVSVEGGAGFFEDGPFGDDDESFGADFDCLFGDDEDFEFGDADDFILCDEADEEDDWFDFDALERQNNENATRNRPGGFIIGTPSRR